MRYNDRALAAICCRAWGRTPDEFYELRERKKISVKDEMAQFHLELLQNPLTGQLIQEMVFPGRKKSEQKKKHQTANDGTFAAMKRMRDRNKPKE